MTLHPRIGTGYDVHAFGPGDHVMLGGVRIAHGRGVLAHSDGDVALHALCDALLGAAGLGDIGRHFPDSDARFKDADSRKLLREAARLIGHAGYRVVNVDATVIARAPRMAPHVAAMAANIAADLGIAPDRSYSDFAQMALAEAARPDGIDAVGRCCTTLTVEDSQRESMRLDGLHEQAIPRPLPHDKLVQLHCLALQARFAVDLAGQGHDLALAA